MRRRLTTTMGVAIGLCAVVMPLPAPGAEADTPGVQLARRAARAEAHGKLFECIGQFGRSKDHRPDRKQMIVGAVLDNTGRPICP